MTHRLESVSRHIDTILDRFDRRQDQRVREFPPDFLHGDAQLDEVYHTLGKEWAETTAFVQHHCDANGRAFAVSVAYFNDWFLTVEHFSVEDGDSLSPASLHRWLRARIGGRRFVLELQTAPAEPISFEGSRWIDIHCRPERLVELERTILHLTRDGAQDWATVAQTNLLSFVTLCARLGLERVN